MTVNDIDAENRRWDREREKSEKKPAPTTTPIHSGRPLYDDRPKEIK